MMRVSPPELAREFPGPQASSNVTLIPFLRSCSADQPPKAPAPTTITELREESLNVLDLIRSAPAMAEPFQYGTADARILLHHLGPCSTCRARQLISNCSLHRPRALLLDSEEPECAQFSQQLFSL